MTKNDCDYSRPGVAPWWGACSDATHGHAGPSEASAESD